MSQVLIRCPDCHELSLDPRSGTCDGGCSAANARERSLLRSRRPHRFRRHRVKLSGEGLRLAAGSDVGFGEVPEAGSLLPGGRGR